MYDKTILIGYLGNDPEMRFTPNGKAVTNFNMAVNRQYTVNGQKVTETKWFRISVWGSQAEACKNYLSQGSAVYIEGQLRPDENGNPRIWTGNDGTPHANFELSASYVKFLPSGNRGNNGQGGQVSRNQNHYQPAYPQNAPDDEIPF